MVFSFGLDEVYQLAEKLFQPVILSEAKNPGASKIKVLRDSYLAPSWGSTLRAASPRGSAFNFCFPAKIVVAFDSSE